jgi:hypothetical protein
MILFKEFRELKIIDEMLLNPIGLDINATNDYKLKNLVKIFNFLGNY